MKSFFPALLLLLAMPLLLAATPADKCLNQIKNAIETGDSAAFEQLVDMDGILSNILDVFLVEAARPENATRIPPMLALMFSQAANQPAIRNLLLQEARSFVSNGISSGAFAGRQPKTGAQQGWLAPLFANASIGRKEIGGEGQSVGDGKNGWYLPFSVHDYGNGNDYPVLGHFTPSENGARLTGIGNLEQLFAQIQQEAAGLDGNAQAVPAP